MRKSIMMVLAVGICLGATGCRDEKMAPVEFTRTITVPADKPKVETTDEINRKKTGKP